MPAFCTTQYTVQQFFFKTLGHHFFNPSNSLSFENSFDFLLSKKYILKCIFMDAHYKISRQMYNNLSITEETLEPLGPPSISLLPKGKLWYWLSVLPFSYFSIYILQCAPSEQYFSNYGWVLNQFNEPGPTFWKVEWNGMEQNRIEKFQSTVCSKGSLSLDIKCVSHWRSFPKDSWRD